MGQSASLVLQVLYPPTVASSAPAAADTGLSSAVAMGWRFGDCACLTGGFVLGSAIAVAAHEISHILAACSLHLYPRDGTAAVAAFGVLRWTATHAISLPLYLLGTDHLVPALALPSSTAPHVSVPLPVNLNPGHWRVALVRHAGWIASALLAGLSCWMAAAMAATTAAAPSAASVVTSAAAAVLSGAVAGCVLVFLGAVASDALQLQPAVQRSGTTRAKGDNCCEQDGLSADGFWFRMRGRNGRRTVVALPSAVRVVSFFCGNIGLLVAAAAGSSVDMMSVLRSQVAISSQRGAQSGGLVALVESAPVSGPAGGNSRKAPVIEGIRSRCAPGKRDHLSVALHGRFGRALGRAPRLAGGHGIFVGHTRFATSSQPSDEESHPHQWSPPFMAPVWRSQSEAGRLAVADEKFGVWITHNGDFDFWRLMGQDRTHTEVAAFLKAALGCPSPAKCDSVRVAGMIELLRTQGMWFPSLRLAYYDTAVGCSFTDVVASSDPAYASQHGAKASNAGGAADPESNHSRRVATRSELQALAAALEAAFAEVLPSIEPNDRRALLLEAAISSAEVGTTSGLSAWCPDLADTPDTADATAVPNRPSIGGMPAAVGLGRPILSESDSVYATAGSSRHSHGGGGGGGPAAAASGAATGFLLERRPSFGAMACSSLAGAVLAAQMSAAVERAGLEHSIYGTADLDRLGPGADAGVGTSGGGGGGGGGGATSKVRSVPGPGEPTTPDSVRARHGSVEIHRRNRTLVGLQFLSVYGDTGGVRQGSRLHRAAAAAGSAKLAANMQVDGNCDSLQKVTRSLSQSAVAVARVEMGAGDPTPFSDTAAVARIGPPGTPPRAADQPKSAPFAASTRGTPQAPEAATAPAAGGSPGPTAAHSSTAADIPVSYGQEAVHIACALGFARDGSRERLVSVLVEAAERHLEAAAGWPAWRSTVPSLERLINTALSYFVANDLYTASCRFLKHAKGSFGLAILCSLEPDRLCMGAWGQPMAMSFSQSHRAVLYGSETNCAMIPIATQAPGKIRPARQTGGSQSSRSGDGASRPAADAALITHAYDKAFEVHRVEDRQADTITLNGATVEIIRDTSRYSCGAGGGQSNYSRYSACAAAAAGSDAASGSGGASLYSPAAKQSGAGACHSTYSIHAASRADDDLTAAVGAEAQAKQAGRAGPIGESLEQAKLRFPGRRSEASGDVIAAEMQDIVKGYDDDGQRPQAPWGPEDQGGEELLVDNGWSPAFSTHRIDIDEGSGEMMQLVLTDPSDPASALDNPDGWSMFRVQPFVRLRVYQLRTGREVDSREDFEAQERIVQLVGNPYVTFAPSLDLTPGRDYVADDLADVSRVLARVRDSWTDPLSLNRQTAEDLWRHLDKLVEFAMSSPSSADRPGIDLLITGVEASLWLAEQWAGDLKLVFPQLNVQAVSANKVISVLGNARGRIPPTGSTFCRSSTSFLADQHTLCIAVSQSGQTFPTIHAARILNQLLPGRVYAMCGSVDTKMALALGQRVAQHSPFTRRVFNSCAGGRCAEPPSVVCVALHQTMSELLTYLVVRMRTTSVCASGRPLGMILTKNDMVDLRSVRDRFIDLSAPQLTGYDAAGKRLPSEHHNMLVEQGRKWALHVIETPAAWVLSLIHILATVVSGWPVVYAIVHGICLRAEASKVVDTALSKIALAVDSVIYMFLPIMYAVLLRAIQRRPLWHRMGKRTIVVADVPYVHQIIETFVSKMYALSYGIASVEVHGANPVDHFVHRFTHRVVRGLLIALGRPDGRLYSQTKSESWVLLGLLQAKVITSWGHQPEVVSIGHNPYHPAVVDTHLQLPTNRPRLLVEALEHTSGAIDPNQLWASRRHMVTGKFPLHEKARELLQEMEEAATVVASGSSSSARGAHASTSRRPGEPSVRAPISRLGNGPGGPVVAAAAAAATSITAAGAHGCVLPVSSPLAGTTAASRTGNRSPVPAGGKIRSLYDAGLGRSTQGLIKERCNAYSQLSGEEVLNMPADEARPLLGSSSKHLVGGHLLYGIFKPAELSKMWDKLAVVRQLASVLSTKQVSESVAREAVAAVGSTLEDVLHKQTVMEQLLESRYLSLERLLSFMVMFHAMARRTADWWPLNFDIARSQSGLRVATTAAPVTASELEQSLAETLAGDVVEAAAQRNEAAGRERLHQILTAHVRRRKAGSANSP